MEDDGHLGEPEFWVSRTVAHALEAQVMGIKGLMGIHWRTRELSLQISALATVPWSSTASNPTGTLTGYDVYLDLCTHDFGLSGGDALTLAAILNRHDGFNAANQRPGGFGVLPGGGGCGAYSPNPAWRQVQRDHNKTFAYVDQLSALRSNVHGPNNLASNQMRGCVELNVHVHCRLDLGLVLCGQQIVMQTVFTAKQRASIGSALNSTRIVDIREHHLFNFTV